MSLTINHQTNDISASSGSMTIDGAAAGGTFLPYPKYVSNWASPNNTYTSSGTWSKGSLDGNTIVWIYLLSGGQGGNTGTYSLNGSGGRAVLLCGWADVFDGGTYVVGAGGAGLSGGTAFQGGTLGGNTSFTLSSANGSAVFTAAAASGAQSNDSFFSSGSVIYIGGYRKDLVNSFFTNDGAYSFVEDTLPTVGGQLYNKWGPTGATSSITATYVVFGGGSGATGYGNGLGNAGFSLYSGTGGARGNGGNGSYPGGGGGGSYTASHTGGNGAAGNVRVYHVS